MRVLNSGAEAAEDAQDKLDIWRGADKTLVYEVSDVANHRHVIDLQFGPGSVSVHTAAVAIHCMKRIGEYDIIRALQKRYFPVVQRAALPDGIRERRQYEVDRSAFSEATSGCRDGIGASLSSRDIPRAPPVVMHMTIASSLNAGDNLSQIARSGTESPCLGIPGMNVYSRGPCIIGLHGIVDDLLRCYRQIRRQGRSVDRTSNCCSNPCLSCH